MGQVGGRDAFAGVLNGNQEALPSPVIGRGAGGEGRQDRDISSRWSVTERVADQVGEDAVHAGFINLEEREIVRRVDSQRDPFLFGGKFERRGRAFE